MSARAKLAGSVAAGFPSPAEQYREPPLDLNALLLKHPAADYFVRVTGDSMIGEGIRDGDLLVVDRSLTPVDGDVIVAAVDGEFTVKYLRMKTSVVDGRRQRRVALQAANPAYPLIRLAPGQRLDYFGKVTAVIHQYGRRASERPS